ERRRDGAETKCAQIRNHPPADVLNVLTDCRRSIPNRQDDFAPTDTCDDTTRSSDALVCSRRRMGTLIDRWSQRGTERADGAARLSAPSVPRATSVARRSPATRALDEAAAARLERVIAVPPGLDAGDRVVDRDVANQILRVGISLPGDEVGMHVLRSDVERIEGGVSRMC